METPRKGSRCKNKRVKLRPMKIPNLNPEVVSQWIWCNTITCCKIEDDRCLALLETGATVNVINENYAAMLELPMGPLSDLCDGLLGVQMHGNHFAGALGYVIVHVWFDEIKGYDEDQVCLVMESPWSWGHQQLSEYWTLWQKMRSPIYPWHGPMSGLVPSSMHFTRGWVT